MNVLGTCNTHVCVLSHLFSTGNASCKFHTGNRVLCIWALNLTASKTERQLSLFGHSSIYEDLQFTICCTYWHHNALCFLLRVFFWSVCRSNGFPYDHKSNSMTFGKVLIPIHRESMKEPQCNVTLHSWHWHSMLAALTWPQLDFCHCQMGRERTTAGWCVSFHLLMHQARQLQWIAVGLRPNQKIKLKKE